MSHRILTVGVLGSGIMGSGLTEVAAKAGHTVIVRSRTLVGAEGVMSGLGKSLDKQVAKEKITAADRDAIMARVRVTDQLEDLVDCDLVIENVVEDLATKQALFAEVDQVVKPHCVLATNTSTLPVVEIAVASGRPDRVCGIHFFNPAPMMKLVEIVAPLTASADTVALATEFAQGCGKDTVEVADRAGFIVNALLFPYLNNAIRMFVNGTASMADIDTAMMGGCGFPMGPFTLLDLVGLDTSLSILDALYAEFGDPNYAAVPLLRRMVAAGHLGRKSGHGFYDHT
ncbi:MAG TPA: 3-hydroxybutyryl-CoA dehydrogenase [Ilumatobacter sp.]|nr:3-hydroxybutyryl-CoA dehydrogenase [Ilumatobacter sp.]